MGTLGSPQFRMRANSFARSVVHVGIWRNCCAELSGLELCSSTKVARRIFRTVWSHVRVEDVVRICGSKLSSWTRKVEARVQHIGFVAGQVGSGRDKIGIDPGATLVQTCLCLCLSFRFLGATDKHTWRVCNLNVHAAPSGRTGSLLHLLLACACAHAATRLQH